jgi:1-acyl-sn-glycerol-3-phosphate acyltransferase
MSRFPTTAALVKTLSQSALAFADAVVGRLTAARADHHIAAWSGALVRAAEVDLRVSGVEHVPRDRAVVVMSNHQSHFDVPITFVAFPGTLRMVAKKELFRVPLFGAAMRKAGIVSVDRGGDRAQARAAMAECAEALARGVNIWIAPEGTRSLDGRLGAFKKGGFLLARDTGTSIVPMAIDGSRNVLGKHARKVARGVSVRVTFGAPIAAPDAAAGRTVEDVMNEVRSFMKKHVTGPTR